MSAENKEFLNNFVEIFNLSDENKKTLKSGIERMVREAFNEGMYFDHEYDQAEVIDQYIAKLWED